MLKAQTLTERTRALLLRDASPEFTVSRMALETLVSDSESLAKERAARNITDLNDLVREIMVEINGCDWPVLRARIVEVLAPKPSAQP